LGALRCFAGTVTDPTSLPAGRPRASIEHAKFRRLLESCQAIEVTLNATIQHLIADYGKVETTTLYQDLELSTADGIHRARERVTAFNAKYDGFADAQERHWVDIEALVIGNDLDEPWATDLHASFAVDRAETFPNYRAWFRAMRDDAAAVTYLLVVAQDHLEHPQWRGGRVSATDEHDGAEFQRAKVAVASAEHQSNAAGQLALSSRDKTCGYVRFTLQRLEQDMLRNGS
jgi:hypothetical protein